MVVEYIFSFIWCHTTLILGVMGNSYVLYVTVYHKAIKLDRMSVWIIQNLALVDILNCVLIMIPVISTLYGQGKWVLGDTFCDVVYTYKYTFFIANVFLINSLSLNKLLHCLRPLAWRAVSAPRHRYAVTLTTVVMSAVVPGWSYYGAFLDDFVHVKFSPAQMMCFAEYTDDILAWQLAMEYALTGFLNALPCLTLCFTNAFLVIYALMKTNRPVNRKNVVVVVLVTAMFLLSMLPFFAYFTVATEQDWSVDSLPVLRFVTCVSFLAFFANPPIFLATNPKFREFTVSFVRVKVASLLNKLAVFCPDPSQASEIEASTFA